LLLGGSVSLVAEKVNSCFGWEGWSLVVGVLIFFFFCWEDHFLHGLEVVIFVAGRAICFLSSRANFSSGWEGWFFFWLMRLVSLVANRADFSCD
jgi:hypothetical protein